MDLAQCRLVTDDVEGLAGFYARLLGAPTALNEYYVEIQAGAASVGFSRRRFTEHREADGPSASGPGHRDDIILDFLVYDVDVEYGRIAALGVDWVMPPATQPWGNRSMMFRDPAGNLVNVFCRRQPFLSKARGEVAAEENKLPRPGRWCTVNLTPCRLTRERKCERPSYPSTRAIRPVRRV